jgi:hypothetical protein
MNFLLSIDLKQKLLFTSIVLSFLFSCNNQGKRIIYSEEINIESGLQNLIRLKTSDFGKTIRYIPLETTDDGLVGRDPIIKVLRDHIVIEAQRSCLLFDKKNGQFITEIGHFGQDPMAFTEIFSWTDEKEEFLYFMKQPNQLVKYDYKGNYCGKVEFSTSRLASYYLLTDSGIVGHFTGFGNSSPYCLGFFDKNGELNDTIPQLVPGEQTIQPEDIASISIIKGRSTFINRYGIWAKSGGMLIGYKNEDKTQFIASNAARIWKYDEHIRFKEEFIDTIYTISEHKLIPSTVFHTGKYHWPIQEITSLRNTNERIFIADVSENNAFVFFQCIKGMYTQESVLYNGLYNKKTGETKLGKYSDAIADDLTQFMPFVPLGMSTAGEFVSLVEVWEVMEWLEKNPGSINNEKLAFLKELNEDMNPIVILIE